MLAEYGLIPDIFDSSTYSSREVCGLHLARLKDVMLKQGLVRDFRDGEWRDHVSVSKNLERWDPRARELLRKLIHQKRLAGAPPFRNNRPANEVEWCQEALASHRSIPLTGIIASTRTAATFNGEDVVRSIERLDTAPWWQTDLASLCVKRQWPEYLHRLRLILKHANLLMFIDPYLDPRQQHYAAFIQLLLAAKRPPTRSNPTIQIHRKSTAEQRCMTVEYWADAFRRFHGPLAEAGLAAEVFIWDDFHDRYLISDLIGILMGNGFDVSTNPTATTAWARITRENRESLQRKFDYPNNDGSHHFLGKFTIGRRS